MKPATIKGKEKLIAAIPLNCNECKEPCAFLKHCSKEILDTFSRNKINSAFVENQRILLEKSMSSRIYFIKKGKVKIVKADKKGNEVIVHIATEGEVLGVNNYYLGEGAGSKQNEVTAVVLEDTLVCSLDFNNFSTIALLHPEIATNMLEYLGKLLAEAESRLLKMASMDVRTRVADTLLTLYKVYKTEGSAAPCDCATNKNHVLIKLGREDIARMAGTTKEQVSKTLSEFKSLKIIRTKGREIEILECKELQSFVEG